MTWLVVGLMVPLVLFLLRELWRRPERQFTLYSSAGRWEEALPWARILARRPASSETRGRRQMNLGTILARTERFDEAVPALEEALVTQEAGGDAYASLTRHTLALLELRSGEVEKARAHARAIESGPEEFRARARMLLAAAHLVEKKPEAAREMLLPSKDELVASKKPSDMATLAVLAVADPALMGELGQVVRERMPSAQRKELAAQLPLLARVL